MHGHRTDTEKLWEDVQSFMKVSFESLEGKFQDMRQRMEHMEGKLNSLQTLVDQLLSK